MSRSTFCCGLVHQPAVSTWATYGHRGDPFNPEQAIAAQGQFMGHLLDQAEASDIAGDPLELALAGYNAGFGALQQYDGIPPYPQTEDYVRLIPERTANYERSQTHHGRGEGPAYPQPPI